MPLVPRPPSSKASISVTRTLCVAASPPLRGPRKPAAIKQVGDRWAGSPFPSRRFQQGRRVSPERGMQTLHLCRERRGGLGSPLRGKMTLPGTPTILCKPRLGCWTSDTKLCLTTGPDPAGPGDRPLPSAGETTDLPTSDPHLLPTASAGTQSCPHLDTSWQGDSGAPART